ncbi:MAG: VOC family protein [Alphaproteobacteria bacterium]|nr:VOC family protein [Alphaproteobacteria bacterium]
METAPMSRQLPKGVIRPAKLAHFAATVRNFDSAVDWYQKVLGADIGFRNDALCFLSFDEEHHRVALLNVDQKDYPLPVKLEPGINHIAFTYHDLGELLATYVRLKKEGILPAWTTNHGPTTSFYYDGPGTRIELQVDNFATLEELAEWFASGAFAQNPIGVDFDADELVRLYEAGVPEAELKRQGSAARKAAA